MVEDLAVEHDPEAVVLVGHGLLAGGNVDDRESGVPESGMLIPIQAELVRATVALSPDHAR
jgi:hypothetical protein